MILTVTPNPSLDRTYEISSLVRGEVLRAAEDRVEPGGKGVNVARAVAAAGVRTTAVLPLGGPPGTLIAELLGAQGVDVTVVAIASRTRSNVSLAEPDGTVTKINTAGPALSPSESLLLLESAGAGAATASWVTGCGSLPPGLPQRWYAELVARVRAAGARSALDAAAPVLRAALAAEPDLVKLDTTELAAAVSRPLATLGDVVTAVRELRSLGAGAVLATLGPDGQLLSDATGTYYGTAPAAVVRSNVGAGDAALAGLLIAGGSGPRALASAVAHATAAVQLPGTAMPTPEDLRPAEVRITEDLPLTLRLTRPAG
ncbi:hexose kinase [Streptomyces sp. NPDC090022]|uniref:hexose kinase n=1 Tax=Streptomyces sp. NPDC090022 TaxID=3365920 RepID=UPI00381790CA